MAINISFASDVRDFLRGTGDITDSLDDVSDALDDLDRDAKDAGKEIGGELEKGAEKAEDAAKELEKRFRDTFDTVKKESTDAGDKVGKSSKDGFNRASEGVEEFKDEANGTAREVAASFDGSFESIMEGGQEVAANALAGFGPAGAVAGIALAAGIGIGIAALTKSAEEAAESKQKVIDLADSIREAGGNINDIDWGEQFREFGNEIADAKSWFEPWQEASRTNFEVLRDDAEKFGLDFRSLFQGMAGDTTQGKNALEGINAEISRMEKALDATESSTATYSGAQRDARAEERGRVSDLKDLRDRLEEASGQTEDAIEYERLMEDAYKGSAAELQDKNEALRETAELTAGAVSSELDYLDALDSTTQKLAENASAGFDKNTAAGRENLRALSDVAQATLDFADATEESTGSVAAANAKIEEGRQKVIDAGKALGMSQEDAEAYAKALGLIPRQVSTTATADTRGAETALQAVARRRDAAIVAMADTEHAQIELNRLAQKTVYVNVETRVGNMRVV